MSTEIELLKSMGMNEDEIRERVLETLCNKLLTEKVQQFDEDGEPYEDERKTVLGRALQASIKERIDAAVVQLGDTLIQPRIQELIDACTLQETNRWGEAKGQPITFKEYLIQRAERYLTEEVNYNGKTREQDSYSWSKHSTRIVHMIHEHLQFHINRAMTEALQNANSFIVKGIDDAVKIALAKVLEGVKCSVAVKAP